MDRIACAWIPRFELFVHRPSEPGEEGPRAVVELAKGGARIRAANVGAERQGVFAGQPVTQARAVCPALMIVPPDPMRHAALQTEVLRALGKLSPLLDSDGRGAFFLGLQGLGQLVSDERLFARKIQTSLAGLQLPSRVAVAPTAFTAWIAAMQGKSREGLELIEEGRAVAALEAVPLSALQLPEKDAQLLRLLGLRTVGALARLPPGVLSRRLGAEGVRLEKLCRQEGLFIHPSTRHVPEEPAQVELDLDGAVEALETVLFLIKSILDRLLTQLRGARRGLLALTLEVTLDDHALVRHTLTPAEPALTSLPLMDLVQLWLGTHPFAAPVVRLKAIASRTGAATQRQLDLFHQQELESAAFERAAARLTAAFGSEALVRARLVDTFLPEARLRWERPGMEEGPRRRAPSLTVPQTDGAAAPRPCAPRLVVRLLNPPEPVEWTLAGVRRAGGLSQRVLHREGPHRLAGGLSEVPFDRSYHWITLADGARWWLFRDEREGQGKYFLQGVAD